MKSRRQDKLAALRQEPQIGAILVHDREPFDALLLRSRLVDKDDAAVEIPLFSGEPLVNSIGNDVPHTARGIGRHIELLSCDLACREDVPEAVFALEPAVAYVRYTANHQRLRVNDAPILETRRGIDIG